MDLKATVDNRETIRLSISNDNSTVQINDELLEADVAALAENRFHVLCRHRSYNIEILEINTQEKTVSLKVNNNFHEVRLRDRMDELLQNLGMSVNGSSKQPDVKAPMPGMVLDVLVQAGQQVEKDTPLLILEAMKMENVIKSPVAGTIKLVNARKGIAVEKNAVILEFS